MRRKRRNYSASFQSKIAFAALKGDKTLTQFVSDYDVRVNQIPHPYMSGKVLTRYTLA